MNFLLYFFIIFLGASCSTQIKTLKGPDGTDHELITCLETEECYESAREVCSGNYDIINSTSKINTLSDKTTQTEQELLIKCQN